MRSAAWAIVILLAGCLSAAVLPLSAAGPLPVLKPSGETPQSTQDVVAAARTVADTATGSPAHSLPSVGAPLGDVGISLPTGFAAGLALVGLGALSAALLSGGARFVTPAEVLENGMRRQIYEYLKARVGANLKQVTDELGLTTTNAIWHLRKLEESGLIHSKRFNGYKVFYPAEGGIEARRLSLGKTALVNNNAQEVFEQVVANPGTHQREIARALGVNHGTVRWHLKKLMSAELITEQRMGKASSYEPTPIGLAALREVSAQRTSPNSGPAFGTAA